MPPRGTGERWLTEHVERSQRMRISRSWPGTQRATTGAPLEALGPTELLAFLAGYYYAMQRIDASRFPEDGRNDFEKQAMQRDRRMMR